MPIAVAENAGPSPCDLQDPLRVKMSAITGSITKKRKKSDAKPQSQINKCLNEKRRRTQENLFIDELTELIFPTDMSSGKTDKCQILQRTVDQIRHIRQQEGSNSHAVQQGEVSSSNRNILSNDQVGSIVLEALDGFLFIVTTEGRVEYVTENIIQYINYTRDDVLGKDIYNIIHHGDHNTFMPSLLPMSLGWTSEPQPQKNRTFTCRFLVKPPDDTEETMEEKQQRVSKYESMQICSALLPSNSDRLESGDVSSESSDIGPSVMCVARRIPPNEKPIASLIEQFTVKLDTAGKIITVDVSGLSDPYSNYLNNVRDLIGTTIKDLCHPHDLSKLTAHLNDTLQLGRSTSDVYRLRVSPDKFLNIQTNSKLFKASMMNSTDFIMATNSIIGPLQESQTSLTNNGPPSSKRQEEAKGCSTTLDPGTRNNSSNVPAVSAATTPGQSSASSSATNPSANNETQNSVVSTDSGRLRNLLTKGASASEDSQENQENNTSQNKHRILKDLLNQQDEDDFHTEHSKVRTSPSSVTKQSVEHSKTTLGNNMLLQLLNEKNDDEDEEARAGFKKRNELLQQLLKDQDDERKVQEQPCKPQTREEDPLLRSLGFRNTTPSPSQSGDNIGLGGSSQVGQKRPGDDGDLNIAVKRPMDGTHQVSSSGTSTNATSKLWEKNKMLASLLAKQPPQPTTIPPIPASVISATPQDKLRHIKQQTSQPQSQQQQQQQQQAQQQQQQPWTGGSMQSVGGNNTITTTATSARTPIQNQSRQLPRTTTNTYLNHMLSQQQRPQLGQMDSEFTGSGEHHQTSTDPTGWDNQSSDPDLSDILDQVIEFVPDEAITDSSAIANLLDVIEAPQNNVLNEKMAISAIQKSLMLCETAVNPTSSTITIPGTPPAYSTALVTTPVTTSHSYQPPPMYQQQTRMRSTTQLVRQNTAQFTQQQQLQLHQQRAKLMQQQQQHQQHVKQRLLQQQQQQQLLIPSNATATDQITTGIQNIDNLLNNTVAPNVSLQRSSVPDSQVSPGYGGSVQMPSSGHRLAHSYSHPSTLPQHPIVNNNFNSGQQVSAAARLSPHSPAGILSFPHPQPLSPRVTQGNYGNTPRLFNVNQVRTQQQPTAQQQLQQQQRSMSSPGTPASTRQSPFPAETFPPPTSPTASQFPPGPNPGAPNPSAQYRLQRTTSTPSATTQLPGGLGSPRHYGGVSKEQQQQQQQQQPLLSPSHPHSGCPATPTHNQHNVTNTQQHFSNQQHSSMIYHTTANTINTAEMQNNQFCYDRTSVPLYSSGPGDSQDGRSLPPGNPVNHQLGGNASSTSEFVRQELRAIVGARTQQQQQQRVPNNLQNNLSGQVSQDDLDALGLNFEMSSADFYGGNGSR